MSGHQAEHSDTGAAFAGLIGGALFIGLILYGIVLLTNKQFAGGEHGAAAAEHKAAVTTVLSAPVA